MDVDEMQILMASVVLLYEDHLNSDGHVRTAKELARGMRMLREAVTPEIMEMCKEFKCRVPAKAKS